MNRLVSACGIVLMVAIVAVFVAIVAAALSSCAPINPTPPPPADCPAVCAHGAELGCAWASPTPNGVTCQQVCEDANTILPWADACIVQAATCAEADACR